MKASIENKKKKSFWPYVIIIGIFGVIVIIILTGVVPVILSFYSSSKSISQAGKTNEAKKFVIPVESYAQSHGWKSVSVFNDPAGLDNSVPSYNEVFLTNQTPYEIAPNILTLIRKEGFLNGSGISSDTIQTTIENHYDLDLGGLDANGNKIQVTISTKEYANDDDSTTKVPAGMTAITVYTEYDGYLNQQQDNPVPSFSCVGSGCPASDTSK